MNGYNDIIAEPSDDEDLATACGFEVISEDELYNMLYMTYGNSPPPSSSSSRGRGNGKLPSNKSSHSLASAASSGVSSMKKPMSSCSLSSQGSEFSEAEDDSSAHPEEMLESDEGVFEEDERQLSMENLWYFIQQKRHIYHDVEEEAMKMSRHHFLTMEHASNHHNRLTEWFANLIHFPDKLRQIAADKHRFNINKVPKEVRDELKHIYVY